MPKNMALSGKDSAKYFTAQGTLKNISGLNYWPLEKVLHEKYRIKEDEAKALADFLKPMLEWYTWKRATAQEMLSHPWLNMPAKYDYKYTDKEYEIMMLKKDLKNKVKNPLEDDVKQDMNELIESDEELHNADIDEPFLSDNEGDFFSDLDTSRGLMDSDDERE